MVNAGLLLIGLKKPCCSHHEYHPCSTALASYVERNGLSGRCRCCPWEVDSRLNNARAWGHECPVVVVVVVGRIQVRASRRLAMVENQQEESKSRRSSVTQRIPDTYNK